MAWRRIFDIVRLIVVPLGHCYPWGLPASQPFNSLFRQYQGQSLGKVQGVAHGEGDERPVESQTK